jgi:adenosylcobyric acid synthase
MAKAIMIQGTSSNSGKSIITAGLCRLLFEDGYKVAPFKAQNMALNSYVTEDFHEMGRAQVVQAYACKLKPDVRMNPILLKPNSDTGSQIIVNGIPIGNMDFYQYNSIKDDLKKVIKDAYESLADDYDVIVIEGAGSPAEINLKDKDIVNMHTAKMASAPVIIVGDIDRGGVFASFVGTYELMDDSEKEIIKGFIINKFRGDITLLESGIDMLEKRTGKKAFGVIPMIKDFKLPDEDSVEFKKRVGKGGYDGSKDINIALIDLPHISNFTDFDPFDHEPDVNLYVVDDPADLKNADIVIIPGSKNVIGDALYIKEKGFFEALKNISNEKTIIGICGGYQILGNTISDPDSIESNQKKIEGIGLLNIETILNKEKNLKQVSAKCIENEASIIGYEIHHGNTIIKDSKYITGDNDKDLGCINKNKNIWGTYIHGIFDNNDFRRDILNKIRITKKLKPMDKTDNYNIDLELSKLAAILRNNLDIKSIYKIIGL